MKQIDTIRAALEQAGEYIRSDLASERGAFEGHEGVSRIDEIKSDLANNAAALAALAELERAAAEPRLWLAEPVAGDYATYENDAVSSTPEEAIKRAERCHYAEFRPVPLYTAPPPAPVAEIREPTPEECERIGKLWDSKATGLCRTGRDMFDAVCAVMWPKEGL